MILVIDNYDSFTFNLVQLLESRAQGSPDVRVVRNDACTPGELADAQPTHVILSPGPGRPEDSGLSLSATDAFPNTPLLGVCLGHQALALAHGARIVHAKHPTHGRTVNITHSSTPPFANAPPTLDVALYHSLVVDDESVPSTIRVTARTRDGAVMALEHRERPHYGVQFHPESFMTTAGASLIDEFLSLT